MSEELRTELAKTQNKLYAEKGKRLGIAAQLADTQAELAYVRLQRDFLLEITWLDLPDDPSESTARWREQFNAGWERKDTRSASPALDRLKEEIAGILLDINNQRVGWGETQFLRMAEARAHRALRIIEELK